MCIVHIKSIGPKELTAKAPLIWRIVCIYAYYYCITGSFTPSQTASREIYLGGLPPCTMKGDIRIALHCFGGTSVSHF